MTTFTRLNAKDVLLGTSRSAAEARAPYIAALRAGDAGRIELERGERPQIVKRRLLESSHETGIRIRSSWADKSQRTLFWKRVGR
jgi:hypothetical protein